MSDTPETLEGRVRAIEAILAVLPEVTFEIVDAARAHLQAVARGRAGSGKASIAGLKQTMKMPLDEDGERALDTLRHAIKMREGGG